MSGPNTVVVPLLLVEDNAGDARLIQVMLGEVGGFRISWVDRLSKALAAIPGGAFSAVLLDLSLPDALGMEGVDAIRRLAPTLPVVILTGLDDEEMGRRAVRHGCQDYLVKGQGEGNLIRRTLIYAMERVAVEEERRQNAERVKRILMQTVRTISLALEMRDPYTTGHQRRVAQLAVAIGRKLGFDECRLEGLKTGSLIHDIGKLHVPAEFLSRPGSLSVEAFQVIKMHPTLGAEIVRNIEFPWPVATMIHQHHERLDGTGYPCGIRGDDIILEARIIAVADVFEAIVSHRPYRPALGLQVALDEIRLHAGSRYDATVVDACLAVVEEKGDTPFDADA
ncbi:MAG: HD domain-containing protein [Magnetospirillum sp.]|nr:HD domain-containing protein [Magnetospirillum sp.]